MTFEIKIQDFVYQGVAEVYKILDFDQKSFNYLQPFSMFTTQSYFLTPPSLQIDK